MSTAILKKPYKEIAVDISMHSYYHNNMMKTKQENKMNQDLLEALDDADKWYELWLGQKLANKRLNDKIAQLEEEVDSLRQLVYGLPDGN